MDVITIGNFIEQIIPQIRSSNDIIQSIGTWSGDDREQVYTIHCVQTDGTKYDINIKENT